ncbi:MAG: LysR family carnitine catabolism transcriptional activator, partial [Paraglaciecola sp.]
MPSVSYRQLLAFIRVAQSTTFAEAAEKMCVSQPALSTA